MARILCSLSSISFTCEHFPILLESRESYHPIFDVPQRKLLPFLKKWAAGELTPTDSYLLFLALLRSSELVNFRVPCIRTARTDSIIAQNMEALARSVTRINTIVSPASLFPSFVISTDTRDLDNVRYWIENWNEHYADFQNGTRRDYDTRKLVQKEAALSRLIRSPHKSVASYATQLAEWAAVAGSFPSFTIKSPFNGFPTSIADYWKVIISRCATESYLFSIPEKDLEELIEHCQEHIPNQSDDESRFSFALFKLLNSAKKKKEGLLNFGDKDIGATTYAILEDSSDTQDLNIKLMVDHAPETKPTPDQYPSKFQFMKAMARWNMAQRYKKDSNPPEGNQS